MNTYVVKHKVTGLFFGGFNADQSVKWVDQKDAERMSKNDASLQAKLLHCFDHAVQQRPVAA